MKGEEAVIKGIDKNCEGEEPQMSFILLDNISHYCREEVLCFVCNLGWVLCVIHELEFKLYCVHMWHNGDFKENKESSISYKLSDATQRQFNRCL